MRSVGQSQNYTTRNWISWLRLCTWNLPNKAFEKLWTVCLFCYIVSKNWMVKLGTITTTVGPVSSETKLAWSRKFSQSYLSALISMSRTLYIFRESRIISSGWFAVNFIKFDWQMNKGVIFQRNCGAASVGEYKGWFVRALRHSLWRRANARNVSF